MMFATNLAITNNHSLCRSTRFNRSRIGTEGKESPLRDSFSAYLPSSDHTVQCLVERAAEFQGFAPLDHFEVVQVVKYHNKQRFDAHYDWRGNLTRDRHTSFFALLEANCSNCGTHFPRVRFDDQTNRGHADERWCRLVNCTADELIFLPQPGNAIFWRNLDDDGAGDKRTLHSGLPVDNEHGTKIGLNIWTNTRSGKERKRDETKKAI
jgi:prolyl 4-hydroxylase